jgi:hypothetical protein
MSLRGAERRSNLIVTDVPLHWRDCFAALAVTPTF